MKIVSVIALLSVAIFLVYQYSLPEHYEKSKEFAVVKTQQTTEKVQKEVEKVQESANQAVANVSKEVTDAVNQMGQEITEAVNRKINQELDRTKKAIYTAMEPMFPWAFIIFFLLLFGALKAVIPFSQVDIVQLTLALMSYIFSVKVFYDMELMMYALEGTFWLSLPFAIVFAGNYFFKDKVADFIEKSNDNLKSKLVGAQLQAVAAEEPPAATANAGVTRKPQPTKKPSLSAEQVAAKRIAEKRAALNHKLKAKDAPRTNKQKAAANPSAVMPKKVSVENNERAAKKDE